MEKFTSVRGAAAPLLIDNVNTDQIAPVQFMRALEPDYETALFARWRGDPSEPFVLDKQRFRRAPILVTGGNFGCGSAREVAVWALAAHGIRCIVARRLLRGLPRKPAQERHAAGGASIRRSRSAFEARVVAVDGQAPFEVDLTACTDRLPGWRRVCVRDGCRRAHRLARRPRRCRHDLAAPIADRCLGKANGTRSAVAAAGQLRPD